VTDWITVGVIFALLVVSLWCLVRHGWGLDE
jgi:hypothetical protein